MKENEDWIERTLTAVQQTSPSVPAGVVSRMKKLLQGALSQKYLPEQDMLATAKSLIDSITVYAPEQTKVDNESQIN